MTVDVHDYAAMYEAQQELRKQLASYDGNFGFLLEMKHLAEDPEYIFTTRQLEAALKSLQRSLNQAGEVIEPLLDPKKLPAGTTRHAVVNADGKMTFLRIDNVQEGNWAGWIFVKHILGPAEEARIGAQRPNGEYRGQWQAMLTQIMVDGPEVTIGRYGREIGKCGVCGLRLTDEESRRLGIGPICRDKF